MKKIDLIIDALSVAQNSVWSALNQEALAAARELKEANADMLSALRAIVAVAETDDSFSMQTIKDCANIAIKQARGNHAVKAATAPTRKEWVGLTDGERNEMISKIQHDQFTRQRDLIGSTQIITEMYLKEKNA
jgi:hypothetical protein